MKAWSLKYSVARKIRFKYKFFLSKLSRGYVKLFLSPIIPKSKSVKNQNVSPSIQIVLDPIHRGWVIEKLANKIIEYWPNSEQPSLTYFPKLAPVVTHWMHFMNVPVKFLEISKGIHTIQVTHIDSSEKLQHLKTLIEAGAIPVFMSKEHAKQISNKISFPFKKFSILPGSDVANYGDRKRILISSNYYPDGRKNENLLINLAEENKLDCFHFTFIGKSWDKIANYLAASGAEVEIFSPNDPNYPSYEMQLEILRSVDCYLYLGFDEGSLGALDAYLLGTPMIISKQGFHLEFATRRNILLFQNYEDFKKKFLTIAKRIPNSPEENHNWSWYCYTERYKQMWDMLISEKNTTKKEEQF